MTSQKKFQILVMLAALSWGVISNSVEATDAYVSADDDYTWKYITYDSDTLEVSTSGSNVKFHTKTADVSSSSAALVTGKQVYEYVKKETRDGISSTNYISQDNTTGLNLSNLDKKIGAAQTGNYYTDATATLEAKLKALDTKIGEAQTGNYYTDATTDLEAKLKALDTAIGEQKSVSDLYEEDDDVETKIQNVAKNTIKKITNATSTGKDAAQKVTLTMADDDETTKEITIAGEGAVDADDVRLLSGKTVYEYLSPAADGNYIKTGATYTTAQNLTALDSAIGKVASNGTFIQASSETNTIAKNLELLDAGVTQLIAYDETNQVLKVGNTIDSGATISVGNRKVTNLANGTDATDAAAYGQLVASGTYTFGADGTVTVKTNAGGDAFTLKLFEGTAAIESGNGGYLTGGALYTELRNVTSTNYISADNTTATNLSNLDAQVNTNATNIQTNTTNIATNTAAIATNAANIATNKTAIETNAANIATNKAAIETNAANIATNKDAIAENKTAIGEIKTDLSNKVSTINTSISGIQNDINTINEDKIGTITPGSYNAIAYDATISENLVKLDSAVMGTGANLDHMRNVTKETNATVTEEATNGIALGNGSVTSAVNAISFGTNAAASAENGVAIGNEAKVSAANSVAIGSGSEATEENTVSIGKAGSERRLTNVAPGVNDTDAVNMSQFNTLVKENFEGVQKTLTSEINKVAAGSAALAALRPESYDPSDKFSIALGYGHYRNANAGALGLFYKPNGDMTVSAGVSIGDGEPLMNMGLSFKMGTRGKEMAHRSNVALSQEVISLTKTNQKLTEDNRAKAKEIASLKADNAKMKANNERMQKQIEMILSKIAMAEAEIEEAYGDESNGLEGKEKSTNSTVTEKVKSSDSSKSLLKSEVAKGKAAK